MSKISNDPRLPKSDAVPALKQRLYEVHRDMANQMNAISEGQISARTNAATAAPATGIYTPGDFVINSAPAELGTAGSKYVIEGWVCVVAPVTFVQKRFLTGN